MPSNTIACSCVDSLNIQANARYRIQSHSDPCSDLGRKLSSLGLVRGTEILIVKIAPLGDPLVIRADGYELSLRRDELNSLNLSVV